MMKKTVTTLLLLTVLLTAMQAKGPVKLGFKGGFELTEMNFNANALRETNRVGYYIGPSIEFGLPLSGLGIDISALYNHRDLKVDDEKVGQKCILLPANLRFGVGVADVMTIFASAGPQLAFNIGDDIFYWNDEEDHSNKQFALQNTTISFNFGVGVRLENHLEVAIYYNMPVGKAANFTWDKLTEELKHTTWSNAKTKTNAWHIALSYYF